MIQDCCWSKLLLPVQFIPLMLQNSTVFLHNGMNWSLLVCRLASSVSLTSMQISWPPQLTGMLTQLIPPWHCDLIRTHTCNTQPFYGSVEFVRDNPGEPVPEETFTHSDSSWSSIIPICFLHLLRSMASSVFNPHALNSDTHDTVILH